MTDNIPITPGTGASVATENILGVHLQRVKLSLGVVDTDNGDVSATQPMPANITMVGGGSLALGQQLAGASIPVVLTAAQMTSLTAPVLAAGTNTVGAIVNGGNVVASATVTRPADTTAYAAGDLIADNTVAGSVSLSSFTIAAARGNDIVSVATRCRLKKTGTSLTNAVFRVHFYNVLPSSLANGDNGVWTTASSGYIGYFDINSTQVFTDGTIGVGGPSAGSMMTFKPVTGTSNLYFLIEARAAYTPISGEVFTVTLEVN